MNLSATPKEFFKFCPKCGTSYTETALFEDYHLKCQSCHFVFYQNPKSAVGAAIINDKKQLLLVKRALDPGKGTWDIPGGFIEWGEDPVSAIIRETQEELHLTISPERILTVLHSWYDYAGIHNSALNIVYLGHYQGEELLADSDVDEFAWFDLDAPPAQLSFPEMTLLFDQLKQELQ